MIESPQLPLRRVAMDMAQTRQIMISFNGLNLAKIGAGFTCLAPLTFQMLSVPLAGGWESERRGVGMGVKNESAGPHNDSLRFPWFLALN